MKNSTLILQAIQLRARLLRKVYFRLWRYFVFLKAKALIEKVELESSAASINSTPAIILTTFKSPEDFLVLSYLFRQVDLTFIAPINLPEDKIIRKICSINFVLYIRQNLSNFSFFKNLFSILRDFNRSVVISLDAAKIYASDMKIDPISIVRLAMKASIPIIPVVFTWGIGLKNMKRCHVKIGRKIFISPRTNDFKDIFFKRRGNRKFSRLQHEDFQEIAKRIFSRLNTGGHSFGPNVPTEMGAGAF